MSNLSAKIQRIIDENYELRIGDYIGQGFNLVGRNVGGFIGYILLFLLIAVVLAFIPIIGSLASWIISPALSIGPYIVANKLDRNEPTEFSDFFRGFDKIWPLFLTSLLTGLIIVLAALPGIIVIFSSGFDILSYPEMNMSPTTLWIGILLTLIPAVYLGVSYTFAPMFVWFYDMDAWQAMEASRKIVGKQWLMMLVFLIAVGLIAAAGLILLVVGILFTAPAMNCALYAAFADVTRLNEEHTGESDIIDHFVPTGN
jgi:hypothetical protein